MCVTETLHKHSFCFIPAAPNPAAVCFYKSVCRLNAVFMWTEPKTGPVHTDNKSDRGHFEEQCVLWQLFVRA